MPLPDFLASHPLALVLSALLLGLIVGSFLNVVIWRLPKMMEKTWREDALDVLGMPPPPPTPTYNLLLPHSHCPHCNHRIRAWENLPLISYLLLRGKCSNCQASISIRYPLTELASGLLSALIAWHFGFGWPAGLMLVLTWCLLVLSMIDIDHLILPDVLVLPLLWIGLIANYYQTFIPLSSALWGAIFGYLSLWLVNYLYSLIAGRSGMGNGDFKLLAMFGAWGGWQVLPLTVLLSSLAGAVIGGGLLLLRREDLSKKIPYGPYLAIAGWIALLWGDQITDPYLQIVGFK